MPSLQRPARFEQPVRPGLCDVRLSFTSARSSWRAVRALPASARPVLIDRTNAALGHAEALPTQATQRRRPPRRWLFASPRCSWRAVRALPASVRPVHFDQINPTPGRCAVVPFTEPKNHGASQRLLSAPPSRSLRGEAHQLSFSSCYAGASSSQRVRRSKVGAG